MPWDSLYRVHVALFVALIAAPAEAKHHRREEGGGAGLANSVVLVIRHAEKPSDGPDLSPAGQARALAYVGYFEKLNVGDRPARPDAVFATARGKASNRPYETVQPLARALGLPIHDGFKNDRFADLAHALEAESPGHTILICWHHGEIPALLRALGADPQFFPTGNGRARSSAG
jgi:broad specificity phosphatase PhoE